MKIKKVSPEFLEAVCHYLNDDKEFHEGGTRVSWKIDPGKLQAALDHAKAAITPTTPTVIGTDVVPKECGICGGELYYNHRQGRIFLL